MELRSADSALNPYLAFALIINAGIYGIKNSLEIMPPIDKNLFLLSEEEKSKLNVLPMNLKEAIEFAQKSEFVKKHLNEHLLLKYIDIKKAEFEDFDKEPDKEIYYINTYFDKL